MLKTLILDTFAGENTIKQMVFHFVVFVLYFHTRIFVVVVVCCLLMLLLLLLLLRTRSCTCELVAAAAVVVVVVWPEAALASAVSLT